MTPTYPTVRRWLETPGVLMASAIAIIGLALAGAAVGIASARTDARSLKTPHSNAELSVLIQSRPEPVRSESDVARMATLDRASLREQTVESASTDPEGDENLRLIDAQERRLRATNEREAADFAAQMRKTQTDDEQMERDAQREVQDSQARAAPSEDGERE